MQQQQHMHKGTYHNRWVVPLLISMGSIWVNAVIDDLQRCQTNNFHGAEVGLPEPPSLEQRITQVIETKCGGTTEFRNVTDAWYKTFFQF